MKKVRKTFGSGQTRTLLFRLSTMLLFPQTFTFVFGQRRGVGFTRCARVGLLLFLFFLGFLTVAPKGTGERDKCKKK